MESFVDIYENKTNTLVVSYPVTLQLPESQIMKYVWLQARYHHKVPNDADIVNYRFKFTYR